MTRCLYLRLHSTGEGESKSITVGGGSVEPQGVSGSVRQLGVSHPLPPPNDNNDTLPRPEVADLFLYLHK